MDIAKVAGSHAGRKFTWTQRRRLAGRQTGSQTSRLNRQLIFTWPKTLAGSQAGRQAVFTDPTKATCRQFKWTRAKRQACIQADRKFTWKTTTHGKQHIKNENICKTTSMHICKQATDMYMAITTGKQAGKQTDRQAGR